MNNRIINERSSVKRKHTKEKRQLKEVMKEVNLFRKTKLVKKIALLQMQTLRNKQCTKLSCL